MAESRRFFKVMMPGFRTKLSLPVAFCRQMKGETLDRAVVKSSELEWHIKVGKCCDGFLYFEDGWEDFVKHHGLSLGDFVVFKHNGGFVFDAMVFDSSACEKESPASINLSCTKKKKKILSNGVKRHHKRVHFKGKNPLEDAKSYSTSTSSPHFITTITPSAGPDGMSCLHIPAEFARSQDLGRASIVILRNASGKLWPVKLCTCECRCREKETVFERTTMRKGWLDFFVANKLKKGDVCLFELDLSRKKSYTMVLDVHIFPLVL